MTFRMHSNRISEFTLCPIRAGDYLRDRINPQVTF
jgi:hypothetical protein